MTELSRLVGAWKLESWSNTFEDTAERIETFGPNPAGHMVIEPGGRIMFLFMREGRIAPANDHDRARLLDDMVAYTGKVRIDAPGRLVTTVDLAWIPFDTPRQMRLYELTGDRLTIRTHPQPIPLYPDRRVIGEIVWRRET